MEYDETYYSRVTITLSNNATVTVGGNSFDTPAYKPHTVGSISIDPASGKVAIGDPLLLDASSSVSLGGGDENDLAYTWDIKDGALNTGSDQGVGFPNDIEISYATAGERTPTLTVEDTKLNVSCSSNVFVQIGDAYSGPIDASYIEVSPE